MKLSEIIIKPIVTEDSMKQTQDGFYTFQVARQANKHQIKKALEDNFGVKVLKVRILKRPGKRYRVGRYRQARKREDLKKAMVSVRKGDKIDVFESLGE